jgi:fibrillarin-like rRNA methylase
VIRGKFIAMNTYIETTERSQINDLMLHLKLLENNSTFNSLKTKNQRIDSTKEVKEIYSENCKPLKEEIDHDYRR